MICNSLHCIHLFQASIPHWLFSLWCSLDAAVEMSLWDVSSSAVLNKCCSSRRDKITTARLISAYYLIYSFVNSSIFPSQITKTQYRSGSKDYSKDDTSASKLISWWCNTLFCNGGEACAGLGDLWRSSLITRPGVAGGGSSPGTPASFREPCDPKLLSEEESSSWTTSESSPRSLVCSEKMKIS